MLFVALATSLTSFPSSLLLWPKAAKAFPLLQGTCHRHHFLPARCASQRRLARSMVLCKSEGFLLLSFDG
jgi:hypothetical protein